MKNSKKKEVLGIMMARGGSKSIPKKAIYPCAGKPLFYYTAIAAAHAKMLDRIVVQTDDEEIASIARSCGVEVPFMEPAELATDHTPELLIVSNALEQLKEKEGYEPDVVVNLRPISPLKSSADIDRVIQLLFDNPDADSVRAVNEPAHTPFKMWTLDKNARFLKPLLKDAFPEVFDKFKEPYNMQRQLLPQTWQQSSYVDAVWYDRIMRDKTVSGSHILPMYFEKWRSVDIDSMEELELAARIIERIRANGFEPHEQFDFSTLKKY